MITCQVTALKWKGLGCYSHVPVLCKVHWDARIKTRRAGDQHSTGDVNYAAPEKMERLERKGNSHAVFLCSEQFGFSNPTLTVLVGCWFSKADCKEKAERKGTFKTSSVCVFIAVPLKYTHYSVDPISAFLSRFGLQITPTLNTQRHYGDLWSSRNHTVPSEARRVWFQGLSIHISGIHLIKTIPSRLLQYCIQMP